MSIPLSIIDFFIDDFEEYIYNNLYINLFLDKIKLNNANDYQGLSQRILARSSHNTI